MLSKPRRCLKCDYSWSRYLVFPTCPKCGTNVADAMVQREKGRLKRVLAVSVVVGVVISILSEFLSLIW